MSAGAHVLKRFTMVSSLSSDLPLDSPLFNNLFFISSCMSFADLPINSTEISLTQCTECGLSDQDVVHVHGSVLLSHTGGLTGILEASPMWKRLRSDKQIMQPDIA